MPRILLCRNTAANWDWEDHTVLLDTGGTNAAFVDELKALDIIQLVPKARWTGWINFVEMMEIEVHYSTSKSPVKHADRRIDVAPPYKQLDRARQSIRLLSVQPGVSADPLICEIITTYLYDDTHTAYEALSYCWGSGSAQQSMIVYSQGVASTQIKCSVSLHSALVHLRYSDKPRTIWADAICINQSDMDEVANQVGMMGRIYSSAEAVLVWLGEGDAETQAAADDLRTILVDYVAATEDQIAQGAFRGSLPYVDEAPDGLSRFGVLVARLSRFFSLPWFWRAWVVQEVWLSRKAVFHLGRNIVEWNTIWKAHTWMRIRAFNTPGIQQITLPLVWSTLGTRSKAQVLNLASSLGLLDLVLQSLDLKASDPRDKVFALLGLAEETHSGRITSNHHLIYPDYTKSTSAVFADFTRWWIIQHKSLRILSAIHATECRTWQSLNCTANGRQHAKRPLNHPTWALWHSGKSKWVGESLAYAASCKASGNTKVDTDSVRLSAHTSRLNLKGVRFGTILSLSAFRWRQQPAALTDAFNRIFDASGSRRIFNGPTTTNLVLHEPGWDDIGKHAHAHCEQTEYDVHSLPCLDDCFCTISGERIGLCPAGARVSDVVVILFGGSVPFIIRETGTAGEWEFVGECYVHGAMDGSALGLGSNTDMLTEEFILV